MSFTKIIIFIVCLFCIAQDLIAARLFEVQELFLFVKALDDYMLLFLLALVVVSKPLIFFKKKNLSFFILCCGFAAVGFLSGLRHAVPFQIMVLGLFPPIKGFLLYFVLSNVKFSIIELRWLLKVFFVVSVIFLIGVLVDVLNPLLFRGFTGVGAEDVRYRFGIPSAISFFSSPARCGWWMSYVFVFCAAAFFVFQKRAWGVVALFYAVGILLTMRMKPILGASFAILTALMILPTSLKTKKIVFFGFLVAFAVLPFADKVSALGWDKYEDYFVSEHVPRKLLYEVGFQVAKDNFPLGAGFGKYGGYIAAKHYSDIYTQNNFEAYWGMSSGDTRFLKDTFWPMIIGETGFLGALIYICILAVLFKKVFVIYREKVRRIIRSDSQSCFVAFLSLAAVMVFVEAVIESTAVPFFSSAPYYVFLFVLIGVIEGSFSRLENGFHSFKDKDASI